MLVTNLGTSFSPEATNMNKTMCSGVHHNLIKKEKKCQISVYVNIRNENMISLQRCKSVPPSVIAWLGRKLK